MKSLLRKLFSPLLKPLEAGSEPYAYKPLNRKILIIVGVLFSVLATVVFVIAAGAVDGYIIPVAVFGLAGFCCLIVGILGTDRAVCKIWGNK